MCAMCRVSRLCRTEAGQRCLRVSGGRSGALHVFKHVAEGEAGFEARDAGEPGEFDLVQTAVVVDAGNARDEHVVILSGHEMATDDVVAVMDGCLECGEDGGGLTFERDADVDGHSLAQEGVVYDGAVAANGSRRLKGLDASRGR